MTDPDRNLIPFPGNGDRREMAEALAAHLLEGGQDPAGVVAQLLGLASGHADPFPTRSQPALPPAPETAARYRVRVDLDGARPPIWRRLELASDLTLAELHDVLQAAMGWTDSHLHHFLAGPKRDHTVLPFLTDFDEEEGDEGINERDVRLDQVLVEVGDRLSYEYDFGDGWDHTLRLEKVEEHDESAPRARVLAGRRACPPEDCGGIGGYEDLLEALTAGEAAGERQRELLAWLGDDWDPEEFSAEEADALVQLTLSGPGGPGIEAALAPTGSSFSPALRDLAEHSRRDPTPLAGLISRAELSLVDEPDAAAKATAVRPWTHLLHVVGSGLKLTAAGWLPPAVVTGIATDLDLLEPWMGKRNREEHCYPVLLIRETATAFGLVRKRKGELLPTARGKRLANDPEALWRHVADSLPLGRREHDRHAGVIMLLAVAAGVTPYAGIRAHGPRLLWSAGWEDVDGGPAPDRWAVEFARPTWDALRVAGCAPGVLTDEVVDEPMRQLARAALLTPGHR